MEILQGGGGDAQSRSPSSPLLLGTNLGPGQEPLLVNTGDLESLFPAPLYPASWPPSSPQPGHAPSPTSLTILCASWGCCQLPGPALGSMSRPVE